MHFVLVYPVLPPALVQINHNFKCISVDKDNGHPFKAQGQGPQKKEMWTLQEQYNRK